MARPTTAGSPTHRSRRGRWPQGSAAATLLAALLLLLAPTRGQAAQHLRASRSSRSSNSSPSRFPPDFVEATPVASPATAAAGPESEATLLDKDAVQFLGPRVRGYPLDFCSRYERGPDRRGIGCGQEAADLWCRAHGFRVASQFLTTMFAPNATWCLGDGSVNPADPDDRDSAVGQHTVFVNITCVETRAAAGPGPEADEMEGPRGEVDGEVILAAPGGGGVDPGVSRTHVERTGGGSGGGGEEGGLKEVGDPGPAVVVAAAAAGGGGGV